MDSVTIVRLRDYEDVFQEPVLVPDRLTPGLRWIQEHCPIEEPTTVTLTDLAAAWGVPEFVVGQGLRTLARTGFFSLKG